MSSKHMEWRYADTKAEGWSSRNYLLCRDEQILAHAGLWPVMQMRSECEWASGAHLIDWAAHVKAPGAGVSLLRQVLQTKDVIYSLGGTRATREILPALGFRPLAQLAYYARPLRPWRQIITHQSRWHWKALPRIVRNGWWSLWPRISAGEWTDVRADPRENTLWPCPLPGITVFKRDSSKYRYLARCPSIESGFYIASKGPAVAGYFVLTFAPGQARIVDAWTPSTDAGSWAGLFALATAEALRHPGANEIVTLAGIDPARTALLMCGYRKIEERTLVAHDPEGVSPAGSSFHFQMADSDRCVLHFSAPAYFT